MSLLDRYLAAVGQHLPASQHDDILAELGDDLRARFEERAGQLGRPLTEDEEAELLKPYGRPLLLAARYRPRQFLIGPNIFPYYVTTLKVAVAIGLVAVVGVSVALAVAGRPVGRIAENLWRGTIDTALSIFTWVTIVFALVEVSAGRIKAHDHWDPRTLPRATRSAPQSSRVEVGLDLVLSALFVAFWTALPRSEFLRTFANSGFEMAPAWSWFYLPVLVVVIASIAVKAVTLVRPDLATFRFVAGLVTTAAGVALLAMMLEAGDLVVANSSSSAPEGLARAVDIVNLSLRVSFGIAIVVNVITTALDVRRYVRSRGVQLA